jgi:hypothetical protein
MTTIKKARFELRKVSELKNWENNPRSILEEDFNRLKEQVAQLGVYKTLLVNQDNIVLGGNMRLRAFAKLGIDEVMCGIVETKDEGEMLAYALSDNDSAGTTDDLKLAEVWHLHPIKTDLFKIQSNTLRPLESIINPPAPLGIEGGQDVSTMDSDLDTYLNGSIKQIVLYFDAEQYMAVMDRLEPVMLRLGVDNHTELFVRLLELEEQSHANSRAKKEAN